MPPLPTRTLGPDGELSWMDAERAATLVEIRAFAKI
jgi:hypothetical protein